MSNMYLMSSKDNHENIEDQFPSGESPIDSQDNADSKSEALSQNFLLDNNEDINETIRKLDNMFEN